MMKFSIIDILLTIGRNQKFICKVNIKGEKTLGQEGLFMYFLDEDETKIFFCPILRLIYYIL